MTQDDIRNALNQIYECIHDHGNGKTKGDASREQRGEAYSNIAAFRELLLVDKPFERESILAAAGEACRSFGKVGAVVMCAIRAKIDQAKEEK